MQLLNFSFFQHSRHDKSQGFFLPRTNTDISKIKINLKYDISAFGLSFCQFIPWFHVCPVPVKSALCLTEKLNSAAPMFTLILPGSTLTDI